MWAVVTMVGIHMSHHVGCCDHGRHTHESQYKKMYPLTCIERRLERRHKSECESAQFDQSLCYQHEEETLHPWLSKIFHKNGNRRF